jgi:hypothetical protein
VQALTGAASALAIREPTNTNPANALGGRCFKVMVNYPVP